MFGVIERVADRMLEGLVPRATAHADATFEVKCWHCKYVNAIGNCASAWKKCQVVGGRTSCGGCLKFKICNCV